MQYRRPRQQSLDTLGVAFDSLLQKRDPKRLHLVEDELERLAFITRLKTLGLSLKEIRDLNAVYAIGGSTQAMLDSTLTRIQR